MSDPAFFGYGSLVNLATHGYADPRPAHLAGWHRVWRVTGARDAAYLSVERGGDGIDGIVAKVPGSDWRALDEREASYDRVDVAETLGVAHPTAVYQVRPTLAIAPASHHGILLSYLDTVVQGYLRVFGHDGPERFFASTKGWELAVIDDRHAPRYPRAQTISDAERAVVDRHLAAQVK